MIAALLLIHMAIGAHQTRWRLPGVGVSINVLVAAGVICVLYFGLGVPAAPALGLGLLGIALTAAWSADRSRMIAAMGATVAVTAALFAEPLLNLESDLTRSFLRIPGTSTQLPLAAALATVGVLILLGQPINELCRTVLSRMRVDEDGNGSVPGAPRSRGWQLLIGGRSWAALRQEDEHVMQLRGGRFIGPLERWLILLSALAGQPALIAAVVAAKGIGRFPELAADRARGAKAEEFLVGSLVSWGSAGLAAILVLALAAE